MGFSLKNIGGAISSAATGGAWSTDGKSGYMQGGGGMLSSYSNLFDTKAFDKFEDFIPGVGDAKAQDEANKINQEEARLNREFQERMSNTAYQRGMEDMRKAGLNPTLAYMQGGASSPSGGAAQVAPASKTKLFDSALSAITGVGGLKNQTTAIQQQQAMNESTIQLQATSAAKNVADAQKITEETKGLGRKASEGELWNKFYKKINNILDTSAKDKSSGYNKMKEFNKRGKQLIEKSPNKKLRDVMSAPLY